MTKVTEIEIKNYFSEPNTNKAGGYDEISSDLVKLSSSILTPVLVTLVNSAFSLGIFPDDLKLAKVVPILKRGDKLNINNYHPISLITCSSKIFEKVIFYHNKNLFSLATHSPSRLNSFQTVKTLFCFALPGHLDFIFFLRCALFLAGDWPQTTIPNERVYNYTNPQLKESLQSGMSLAWIGCA